MRFNESKYNRMHIAQLYDWGQEWLKSDDREIPYTDIDPQYSLEEDEEAIRTLF